MTCESAIELISAKLDGELSANEIAQLDCHLCQCSCCRALQEELSAIHTACEGLEVAPPSGLGQTILQNLPVQEGLAPTKKVVAIRWKRWGAMAASFALVALAAWHLPQIISQPSESTSVPAPVLYEGVRDSASLDDILPVSEFVITGANMDKFSSAVPAAPDVSPAAQLPESVMEDAVNANSIPAQRADRANSDALQKAAITDVGGVHATSYAASDIPVDAGSGEETSVYGASSLAASSRMAASTPMPERTLLLSEGDETDAPGVAAFSDEIPEPHPEVTVAENAPAMLFCSKSSSPVYCGVLTLHGSVSLNGYTAQIQENGETWYELPCVAFFRLTEELADGEVDFTLCMSGADVSASAQYGLVITLP